MNVNDKLSLPTLYRPGLGLLLGLTLLAILALLIALTTGSAGNGWEGLLQTLTGERDALPATILQQLRWPRAVAAFVTGGLLATAGVLMQVLLRNPLADPYVLGISGGAATAVLLGMLLGLSHHWTPAAALVGALVAVLLVFGLARGEGQWNATRTLLIGVVLAAGWGAVISLILVISPAASLHGMLFWLIGDLSQAQAGIGATGVFIAVTTLAWLLARPLNLLMHGEMHASALGVEVRRLNLSLYFLASVATATAVSIAGSIGFVGLIVPHLLRLIAGSDHRILVPAAALAGGSLLLVADTLARTAIAPQQLPVGVVTALLGVPVFLWLLTRKP